MPSIYLLCRHRRRFLLAICSYKVKEVELQKKDYQEFVNWGDYMKEKNPNSWHKWESGEVKYTPAPDKQP